MKAYTINVVERQLVPMIYIVHAETEEEARDKAMQGEIESSEEDDFGERDTTDRIVEDIESVEVLIPETSARPLEASATTTAPAYWSVLYEDEGVIHQIGPFTAEADADAAAIAAQAEQEFDVLDQRIYLFTPDHRRIEYSPADLGVDDEPDDAA